MSEHTPEPWDGREIPLTAAGLARTGLGIVFTNHPATRDEAEANARRIVACVNACAGISTENLEDNKPLAEGLRGLNERIRMVEQQRNKLLAALKESLPYISEDRGYNNAAAVIAMLESAPPPPKLSDERILEIWANNSGRPVTMGKARIIAQARAIEREILGGGE